MWAGERMGRNSVVGGSGSSSFTGRAPNAQMIGALVHRQSKKKKVWISPSVFDVWLPALALVYLGRDRRRVPRRRRRPVQQHPRAPRRRQLDRPHSLDVRLALPRRGEKHVPRRARPHRVGQVGDARRRRELARCVGGKARRSKWQRNRAPPTVQCDHTVLEGGRKGRKLCRCHLGRSDIARQRQDS